MPQVAVPIAAALAQIGIGPVTALFIADMLVYMGANMALSKVASLFGKRPDVSDLTSEVKSREITVRNPIAPWRILYGNNGNVGGTITFLHVNGEWLHVVITLSGSRVKSISDPYFDGELVPIDATTKDCVSGKYANLVHCEKNLGTTGSQPFPGLVTDAAGYWSDAHRQEGRAKVWIRLKYDETAFPGGIPNITFNIEGKDDIYDPRTSTSGYTDNAALCVADYIRNTSFGLGDVVNDTALVAAANVCDESVALSGGGSEKRYTCNGSFVTSEQPGEILRALLGACAGYAIYTAQGWSVYPGAWRGPSVTLEDKDLRGGLTVESRISRREIANGIKGVYVSPTNNWQPSDFPVFTKRSDLDNPSTAADNDPYLAEDGERIWKDIELRFTTSATMAQRIAKITLERLRRQKTVRAPFKLSAYEVQPPDTVNITRERFGWTNKTFEVAEGSLVMDKSGDSPILGVDLVLRETDANVYAWDTREEKVPASVTDPSLPSRTTAAPTNVQVLSDSTTALTRTDGLKMPRIKITWDALTDPFVTNAGRVAIQYKKTSESIWQSAPGVLGAETVAYISTVSEGTQYDVRIRAHASNGAASTWVQGGPVTATTGGSSTYSGSLAPTSIGGSAAGPIEFKTIATGASSTAGSWQLVATSGIAVPAGISSLTLDLTSANVGSDTPGLRLRLLADNIGVSIYSGSAPATPQVARINAGSVTVNNPSGDTIAVYVYLETFGTSGPQQIQASVRQQVTTPFKAGVIA